VIVVVMVVVMVAHAVRIGANPGYVEAQTLLAFST